MSAADDVARMLTLVPWLLERQGATITEAAEAFGVPPATIARDVYHLDFCGLPGLGGGALFDVSVVGERIVVAMADELRRPLRLTPREALRLVLTVEAVAAAMGQEVPALTSALAKVRAATGLVHATAVAGADEGERWLAAVRDAINEGRRIRLSYQGRDDETPSERELDPWALRLHEGAWYVQGHDIHADGLRTFRLDRVAELEVTDVPVAAPPPDGRLPAPRYVPDPEHDLEVVVELAPDGRWLVEAVEGAEVTELPDGGVRLRFHSDAPGWVERLLMTAGAAVRAVRPEPVATAVQERARRALRRYAELAPDAPRPS